MYRISRRLSPTTEEKTATKIGHLLSDFTLDLEAVGKHLALSNPYILYSRAVEVLEAMKYNQEVREYREQGKYYGDGLFK